ncbi:MAG: endonuclease/exonuclease/phosphatase family protein [Candidatus Competibacteraceae bacterium]|nr:endonuclease/exonuclease/phosphatase family protein [Candidatus Competibacteraceae bacterium]
MLTLSTFNLRNLGSEARPERLAQLATIIHDDLADPDILAVQEIKAVTAPDDERPVPADATYQKLTLAITAAGGPDYAYCEIPPLAGQEGGEAGSNIRVGLLFNPQRVDLQRLGQAGPQDSVGIERFGESPALSLNPGRVAAQHPAFAGDPQRHWVPSRKALAVEFQVSEKPLFVIVCHLKSMRSSERREREYTKKQRHVQAQLIHQFAAELLSHDPQGRVVILGDMNDVTGSKTLDLLKGDLLHNVLETIPKKTRYTHRSGQRPQTLDHVLVSSSLQRNAFVRVPHVNSDSPPKQQASDHDPVWVRLTL